MNNKIIVRTVTGSISKKCKLQGDQVLPLTKFKLSFLLKMQTEMLIKNSNEQKKKMTTERNYILSYQITRFTSAIYYRSNALAVLLVFSSSYTTHIMLLYLLLCLEHYAAGWFWLQSLFYILNASTLAFFIYQLLLLLCEI